MNEKERKKVKFSLTKFTKKGSFRFVGFGEIDDENLYTKSKTYEDCIRYCHKVPNSTNEFKGSFNEFEEIEFENDKISAADMRKSKKYKKACEKELEVYHKLKPTLNKEQDKLLEELLNLNSDSAAICEKEMFIYAFKVGLRIGIESNKLNN